MPRQLISVDDLNDSDLCRIFFSKNTTEAKELKFKQKSLLNMFLEPSTRTKLSFSLAAHDLNLNILDFSPERSAMVKGEEFLDTMVTLHHLGLDLIVIRAPFSLLEYKYQLSAFSFCLINAGDGQNEHPTQALLDCKTLLARWERDNLEGKKILIVGDTKHSRVASSNIKLMRRLGAKLSLLGPKSILRSDDTCETFTSFSQIKENFDAVMVLRMQKERFEPGFEVNEQEYFHSFALNPQSLESLGNNCLLLHPGPQNWGVEICPSLKTHPNNLINSQVKNGPVVRKILMELLLEKGE